MARKFLTLPRLLTVFAAIIIIVVVAVWYTYYSAHAPPTSISPTPTPTVPSSPPTPSSTPKPSSTPSNSAIPTLTTTPRPTASPTNPTQTTVPTPTLPSSPSPSPTTIPTATPTPTPSPPITVVFNFDNATPTLTARHPTPFDQTSNGVTAHFSSPSETVLRPAFSVQDLNSLSSISTVVNSPKFSGLFLWPSTINRDRLDISFSLNITSISFVFKTAELHDPGPGGTGSPIRLTAYMNSLSTTVSSPITANGVETPLDTYPEGTLTFSSGGQPFNLVEIDLPSFTGATGFIIDNISVTTA